MGCFKFFVSNELSEAYQRNEDSNSLVSIHQIPGEILRKIFKWCHAQDNFLRLRLVCQQWNAQMNSVVNLRLTAHWENHLSTKFSCALVGNGDSHPNFIDPVSINYNRLAKMVKQFVIDVPSHYLQEFLSSFTNTGTFAVDQLIIKTSSIHELSDTVTRSTLETAISHRRLNIQSTGLSIGNIEGIDILSVQSEIPLAVTHLKLDTVSMAWLYDLRGEHLHFGKFVSHLCLNVGSEANQPYNWLSANLPSVNELTLNTLARMPDPSLLHLLNNLHTLTLSIGRPFTFDHHHQHKLPANSIKKLAIVDDFCHSIPLELREILQVTPNLEEFDMASVSGFDCFTSLLIDCHISFKRLTTLKLTMGNSVVSFSQSGFDFDFMILMCNVDLHCPMLRSIAIDTSRCAAKVNLNDLVTKIDSFPLKSLKRFVIICGPTRVSEGERSKFARNLCIAAMKCLNDSTHAIDYEIVLNVNKSAAKAAASELRSSVDYLHTEATEYKSKSFLCRYDIFDQPLRSVTIELIFN